MSGGRTAVYVSISMSPREKEILDAAVRESGKTRNRFLRDYVATLEEPEPAEN